MESAIEPEVEFGDQVRKWFPVQSSGTINGGYTPPKIVPTPAPLKPEFNFSNNYIL